MVIITLDVPNGGFSDDFVSGKILHVEKKPDVRCSQTVLQMNLFTLRTILLEKCGVINWRTIMKRQNTFRIILDRESFTHVLRLLYGSGHDWEDKVFRYNKIFNPEAADLLN